MSRTALYWNPITQQTDLKKKCTLKNNQLNYLIKGSKFDLIKIGMMSLNIILR